MAKSSNTTTNVFPQATLLLGNRNKVNNFVYNTVLSFTYDECLIWPFHRDKFGYGKMRSGGEAGKLAHRVICTLVHGEPPSSNHEAAHSCGNGYLGCVSPKHLSWKTKAENEQDKVVHGRSRVTKLSVNDIKTIRELKGRAFQVDIGTAFGVDRSAISKIWRGINWQHLP